MNEPLNKKNWQVPQLTDGQISGVLEMAEKKLGRRKRNRNTLRATVVACLVVAASFTAYNYYPKSIHKELSVAGQLIREELNRRTEPNFFADGTNYEHSYEEASHASILE